MISTLRPPPCPSRRRAALGSRRAERQGRAAGAPPVQSREPLRVGRLAGATAAETRTSVLQAPRALVLLEEAARARATRVAHLGISTVDARHLLALLGVVGLIAPPARM